MPKVEYRDIAGFKGYRVGSDGTVWTCRYCRGRLRVYKEPWRLVRQDKTKRGYHRVDLTDWNGVTVRRLVHQLVLEAFVGPRPPGLVTCHDPDPNKSNNNLSNLRWGTHLDNTNDRRELNDYNGFNLKLTSEQVLQIRREAKNGKPLKQIAREFAIAEGTTHAIVKRKIWTWLKDEDNPN